MGTLLQTRGTTRSALLLGGTALVLAVPLVWLLVRGRSAADPVAACAPPAAAPAPRLAPEARAESARVAQLVQRGLPDEGAELARSPVAGAKKERQYFADFLELERRASGALDARARDVLEENGPAAEKIALLRATCARNTPQAAEWLELAVRASGREGLSSYALEQLGRRALANAAEREALGRLCLSSPLADLALRRRATGKFAAAADEEQLAHLGQALLREQDELVIASALTALQGRAALPAAQRILEQWPDREPAATPAEEP